MIWYKILILSALFTLAIKKREADKKYYLLIESQTKIDTTTGIANNKVIYFGLIPKNQSDNNFDFLNRAVKNGRIEIESLKSRFTLVNIFFPIHKDENFDEINTDMYLCLNLDFNLDKRYLKDKINMHSNVPFSRLRDFNYCGTFANHNSIEIIELEGNLQYLTSKAYKIHKVFNGFALKNIASEQGGVLSSATSTYDSRDKSFKKSNTPIECNIFFNNLISSRGKSFIDFRNKVLKDTIIYKILH